ncbi:MAG: FAD synthetase family protein [Treponema sp.]|nr:FAD synthetase family protein [Treponema sp.]MCL2233389.1 FAD synthetase family protein [Treponema sp.]
MQIIEWPQFLENALPLGENHSAITVGVFDGVHRGHKALIEQVIAHKDRAVPVVVTFRQSHHKKAQGREYSGSILSFRQKMAAFARLGISITVVIEFSESFRHTGGTDFLRILHEQGKMSFLAVGSNFRCGCRLDTDAHAIQNFCSRQNISAAIVPVLAEGCLQISSSRIRAAIKCGDLKSAEAMLDWPFTLDLAGASVSPAGRAVSDGIAYDISSLGRILPPPGRYAVQLLGEKDGQSVKTPAQILVKGESIIVDGDLADTPLEYVEFSPA